MSFWVEVIDPDTARIEADLLYHAKEDPPAVGYRPLNKLESNKGLKYFSSEKEALLYAIKEAIHSMNDAQNACTLGGKTEEAKKFSGIKDDIITALAKVAFFSEPNG
jgi:hypothetical protein